MTVLQESTGLLQRRSGLWTPPSKRREEGAAAKLVRCAEGAAALSYKLCSTCNRGWRGREVKQLADAPPMGANRQKLGLAGHRQGVCSVTPLSGGGGGRIAVRRPSSYKLSSVCPHAAATAAERSFGGHEGEAAAVGSQSSAQHLIFPAGAWRRAGMQRPGTALAVLGVLLACHAALSAAQLLPPAWLRGPTFRGKGEWKDFSIQQNQENR